MADLLLHAGIRAGDRVAVISNNRAEIIDLWLGCSWIGAVLIPINVSHRGLALAHVIRDAEPSLMVVEAQFLAQLEALPAFPKTLRTIWTLGEHDTTGPVRVETFEPLPEVPTGLVVPPAAAAPGDICAILYTSGTTGPAKGVCCPHAQFYWWGLNTARVLEVREDDVLYTCLPLFHTNALNTFVQAIVSGSTYFLGPRFSASRHWQRLHDSDATVTYALGTMISILARAPESAEPPSHRVRVALSPATPGHLFESFRERFGIKLVDGHGMTETNYVIGPRDDLSRPGLMGRILPGFDARVVDDNDNPLPDGSVGELVLRSDEPYAFALGYWQQPEATVRAWRNLWFHTGDRVIRDQDGYFRFVDRMKDSMRRRGENISAWDVEQALLTHPDVSAVAAYAVPSELGEDEVMVTVVLREGSQTDPEQLIRHSEPLLAYFAIPRYIEIAESLPMTPTGKVHKVVLRDRGRSAHTWDREAAGVELTR